MKQKIFTWTVVALAIYGAYKGYKNVKAKGGIMQALGIKK
jgi:hypothetical protein